MAGTVALVSEHASPAALLGGQDAGGQNVYVDELSRRLTPLGWAVDVFTRRDSPAAPEVLHWAPGVRIVNLAAGPATELPKDQLWPLMPAFRDAFVDWCMRERRSYDMLHGNFWMSGWVVAELRRRLGTPAVQIFHALGATKRREQGDADSSPAGRLAVERAVAHDVDGVVYQCPCERDELLAVYGADPSRLHLVSCGVDLERFRPVARLDARRRLGVAEDCFVITYVGRLVPRKDVGNILRAAALLQPWIDARVVVLVVGGESAQPGPRGTTPELQALSRLAAELGIAEQVRLVGQWSSSLRGKLFWSPAPAAASAKPRRWRSRGPAAPSRVSICAWRPWSEPSPRSSWTVETA